MATCKLLIVSLVVSLIVLHLSEAKNMESTVLDQKMDCGGACASRCRLSSRPNLCKRACGTCCNRCNCVPPGTAGNLEVCPCYATMTTHGGRRKCP